MEQPRPSSSPQASSPAPATDASPLSLSRSLSVGDYYSSPHPFRGTARKSNSSFLATDYNLNLPFLDLNDRVLTNEAMTSPLPSRHSKSRPGYLPLSVRNSTLFPFDFDPAEAMAKLEHKVTAPMSAPAFVRSLSEGTGGETHVLAKMRSDEGVSVTLVANPKGSSNTQAGETQRPIESLSFNTPSRTKTGIRAFSDSCTSIASATPSKNNLGNLLKELDSSRSNQDANCSTPSIVNMTTTKGSPPGHGYMVTPQKRHDVALSPRSTIRSILSPRSFSATDLFYSRSPSKSREEYDGNEIVGDLEFLCSQPPPDLSQHPSMAADPFSSKSTVPTMFTHMTISQTRQWAIEFYRDKKQRWMESQTRPFAKGEPFPTFKQPVWISKDEELIAAQMALAAARASQNEKQDVRIGQASPVLKNGKTPKTPLRIDTKAANSPAANNHAGTRTATPLTDDTSKKSENASVRSFSNLFKSRSATDRSSTSSIYQEKVSPEEKREQSRATKERYLRTLTNCPSFEYSPTSVYPRHPNTGRDWRSRNLRCAGCQWVTCGVCGRACCARAACFYAMENHKENAEGMVRAKETKSMIEHLIPTDAEVQTFLTCTSCKKEVCPDCCGICPNEACRDIQCRYCKRGDPWDECKWHKAQTMRQGLITLGIRPRSSISI